MSDDEQPDAAWWPLDWTQTPSPMAVVDPTPIARFTYDAIRVYTRVKGVGYVINAWRSGGELDYTVRNVDDIFALRIALMRIQRPYPEGN
jgi:hypothetical protein